MNYVIANITDELVTKGEKYPILSMQNDGMINIDVHGTMVCFDTEDKDFTVCLNNCDLLEQKITSFKMNENQIQKIIDECKQLLNSLVYKNDKVREVIKKLEEIN